MAVIFRSLPNKETKNTYDDIRRLSNSLLNGKMNVSGSFVVTANTLQTEVNDRNVGENSFIGIIGLDENSLLEGLYIKSKDVLNKNFTVGHSSKEYNRKYSYVVIG